MIYFDQAQPVWGEGLVTEKNITIGLRATVQVKKDDQVDFHIASSGIFRIFINGRFAGHGPARGPHDYYRVDQLDLSLCMMEGKNVIAIEAVCYNVNSYYLLDQPAFIQVEVFLNGQSVIATRDKEKSFEAMLLGERVQKVQRYSFQRPFSEVYHLTQGYSDWRRDLSIPVKGITLERVEEKKLIDRRVSYSKFNKLFPEALQSQGKIVEKTQEVIWKDRSLINISPKLKGYKENELDEKITDEHQKYQSTNKILLSGEQSQYKSVDLKECEYIIYKMSHNNTGFIGAQLKCTQDTTIYFTFDEIMDDEGLDIDFKRMGCANIIKCYLKKGIYEFESFEPYTFKYLKVWATKECAVQEIYLREYVNSDIDEVEFKCSNDSINKIFEAGLSTFAQNAVDIYMDCPSRERAGWLCDSFFTGRVEYDLTGESAIEKNFLENFIIPPSFNGLPDGMLPMCYPADHYDEVFIPNWSMWFILELEEYYKRAGDYELVNKVKEKIYSLLTYLDKFKNEDGLLENLESWIFVEWSKSNEFVQDVNYPTNMLYAQALEVAGHLYEDDTLIREGQQIKEVIRRQAFNRKFFIDNALRVDGVLQPTDNITETCQYYAFFFGVATKERYPDLFDTLLSQLGPNRVEGQRQEIHPSNAFIGNYLRLEVLSHYGQHKQVIKELEDYFFYMAEKTGTLWENKETTASCNHGFASHVIRCIYRDGAGIREVNNKEKTIIIDHDHINLEEFQLTLPTEKSNLKIKYENGVFELENDKEGYVIKDTKNKVLIK
ncbi:alpha-L-rhamnosidase-related protein [Vallitalea okinawensis]|uniref:alpha-L-rhamnosidase-related protein n=1 Tax=Vallitalea okinawensis TaxID=2078660 RepID=UPI000CFCA1B0|nr:family 78 glycoside hydrolase catalytic domain [Vallitalea okinawensis]